MVALMAWLGSRTNGARSRAAALTCAALLAGYVGCTTDHDSLARKPPAGKSGAGGGGAGGFAGSGFGNAGNPAQGGRNNPDYEPPGGDDVLTLVNGVVDAESVRVCFARVDDAGESELVSSPLPELGYGASTTLIELEQLSFVDDHIQAWVIAGELELIDELDCRDAVDLAEREEASVTPARALAAAGGAAGAGGAEADAPAGAGGAFQAGEAGAGGAGGAPEIPLEKPRLRARAVAALPAGSVATGRSVLMVLTGCIGGAAYADRVATSACGASYSPQRPSLQPVVVKLSRQLRFDTVGLQAVHASLPTETLDVRATNSDASTALVFASSVAFGSIEPRPADTRFTKLELGVERADYGLQVIGESGSVAFQEAWPAILERSGIADLQSGRAYTAIFLGPAPRLIKTGFWNDNAFVIVDNDPTRE